MQEVSLQNPYLGLEPVNKHFFQHRSCHLWHTKRTW